MSSVEPITIQTTGDLRLAGMLHSPITEPSGLGVIVAHGMLSSKDSEKHTAICDAVAAHGSTALRFDFRGRGESEGDSRDLMVSNEVEDIAAAVAWLRDRGLTRIALIGSSLGGTVSLLAAAADKNIAALITIAAPARLPDQPRKAWGGSGQVGDDDLVEVAPGEWIHRNFFADAAQHDPVAAARSITCPWLIIHGALDPVVTPSDATILAETCPSARFELRARAGHRFTNPVERAWLVDRTARYVAGIHC